MATTLRHLRAYRARLLVLGALLGALVPLDASVFHVNTLSAALRLLTAPLVP
jgi:hypothetical protein